MTQLSAMTRIICPDAPLLGRTIAEHLASHGTEIASVSETTWSLASTHGAARLIADAGSLHIETSSPDADMLMEMKYLLASHVGEFNADAGTEILWRGDGDEIATLPNVRTLAVTAIRDLSTHIRRITFAADRLKRFDTLSALHAKLLLPRGDRPLCLPRLSPRGTVDWGADNERAIVRKYTLRRIDAEAGTLDIDFVLHDHGGPGSRFAKTATCGDVIGMIGPGGGSARPADWNLFAGDETALPAIARLLETLPTQARGAAVIEIADTEDEQAIRHPPGIDIIWLHRRRVARPDALAARVASMAIPPNGSFFAWAGAEFDAFRKIRSDWRSTKGIARDDHLAVSYWRKGNAQT